MDQRIVIDGNDGTGKSTLVNSLRCLGFRSVEDRGEMSAATLVPSVGPAPDTTYILLTCDWQESRQRLIDAGQDMTEKWHTDKALKHYAAEFIRIAPAFNAKVIETDTPFIPYITLLHVIRYLDVPIRLGCPSGNLAGKSAFPWPFDEAPMGRMLGTQHGPLQIVWTRSRTYPQMVAFGSLDCAVVGSDVLEANPYTAQVEVIEREPQAGRLNLPLRVVVASLTGKMPKTKLLKVVTPFPEWAQRFFGERGVAHTIFSVGGGSEGLLVAGIGDVLFDIVETGNTLTANGLHIFEEVGTLDTCIIRKRI